MDGMFYRGDSDQGAGDRVGFRSVARLLLITVVAAIVVVGVMMVLASLGVNLTIPSEFPS